MTGSKLIIKNNGKVRWTVPLMIKSACHVDVTYFPYDHQECAVKFGSWIYDESKIDLFVINAHPDLSSYLQVGTHRYIQPLLSFSINYRITISKWHVSAFFMI